jgi:SNF2 family DNA or RNA helicase
LLGSWILDPASYYSRAGGHGQNQMPASVAAAVLPPILRLVQFRRTKADIVEDFGPEGQIAQIGESLKPFQIVTVELDASPSQRRMMRETHNDLLPDLIKGADADTGESHLNTSVCQRLFLSNLHSYSERIYTRKGKFTAKVVDTWYDATDEGATFFLESTKLEASMPTRRDRPSLSWFIGYDSAKLQYLAGIVRQVCFVKKRKLLIFIDWPFNLWLVHMFLHGVLGIDCLTIQAEHTNAERREIEDMFNDPRHPAKCLIASIRTSGTALDLQDQFSDVVLLDLTPNENLKIQCLGRVYRVGQEYEVP